MSHSEALPTTVGVNTPKRYGQLRVKDLPKVITWDSNQRPSRLKEPNPTTEPPRPTTLARGLNMHWGTESFSLATLRTCLPCSNYIYIDRPSIYRLNRYM